MSSWLRLLCARVLTGGPVGELSLRRVLQSLKGGTHVRHELLVAVRGNVDNASPQRDPADLVGLGDPSAAVLRLEPIPPDRRLATTLVGDERELSAAIGNQDPTVARVTDPATGADGVVPDKGRSLDGNGDRPLPLDALALRAPRPDALEIGDHLVQH